MLNDGYFTPEILGCVFTLEVKKKQKTKTTQQCQLAHFLTSTHVGQV